MINITKILFLSLLATVSVFSINTTQAQYYDYSSLNPKSDISLYPWETPDTSRPEEYCEDYSYSTDISQVEVRFTKENNETFQISCIDPQNSWMWDPQPMTYQFKPYTVTATNYYGNNRLYEEYPQTLDQWCNIQEWGSRIVDLPNYTDYIRFTPIQIKSENRLEINCVNTMNWQHEQIQINYKKDENQTPPAEKIEWCTDSTAINYNPQANVHIESSCQYNTPYTPQDISGAFEKSQVSIGATTWTMRVTLNMTGAILDPNSIQTWDQFTAVDSTTNDKTVTLTLRQFDDQRLDVECTNYEVTIPRHALTTTNGDTNPNPISGNFEVVGCQNSNTDPQDPSSQNEDENNPKYENTIKENNFYLSLYDTDEKGKIYLNLTNIVYFVGFIAFFVIIFFVLFWFIKNSFLWKSKR